MSVSWVEAVPWICVLGIVIVLVAGMALYDRAPGASERNAAHCVNICRDQCIVGVFPEHYSFEANTTHGCSCHCGEKVGT